MGIIGNSNLRFIRAEEGDNVEFFMTHIIMIEKIVKSDTDQIVVMGEISIDKAELDPGMNKIRQNQGRPRHEQNYARGNFRGNARLHQDLEDRIAEENTEVIIGMDIIAEKEVGIGLGKDCFQGITIIIEGMIEV